MASRYTPYNCNQSTSPSTRLELWVGSETQCHPLKNNTGNNADVVLGMERCLGVLDGVSGVAEVGLLPAAMSTDLAVKIQQEMRQRLDRQTHKNAQTQRHEPRRRDRKARVRHWPFAKLDPDPA